MGRRHCIKRISLSNKKEEDDTKKKIDGFDEKIGVEMKFEKIVKALVAACPEATTIANRRGEKPGEAV